MKSAIHIILVIFPALVIFYCFKYLASGDLTTNEQVLFNLIIAIASVFLSWLFSHFYYEKSHEGNITEIKKDYQSSLKVYASKAAEKVTNLSAEFDKLTSYLKEELDDNEYESDQENLNAKEERIYSAIHIINTLKSINDGTLSDWKGIIPEEIEEIEEEKREKFESINSILSEYQKVVKSSEEGIDYTFKDEDLKEEIRQLNKKIDLVVSNVAGVTIKSKKTSVKKEKVEKNCPECGTLIQYKQRPILASRKGIECKKCGTKLSCLWDIEKGFSLVCSNKEDVASQASQIVKADQSDLLSEDFMEIIKNKLPVQPWPKKIGDSVAKELGVSSSMVHKAINILIERGIFKHQMNGIVYIPDPDQKTALK